MVLFSTIQGGRGRGRKDQEVTEREREKERERDRQTDQEVNFRKKDTIFDVVFFPKKFGLIARFRRVITIFHKKAY